MNARLVKSTVLGYDRLQAVEAFKVKRQLGDYKFRLGSWGD